MKDLQHALARHNQLIKDRLSFDLTAQSKENYTQLKNNLQQGAGFLNSILDIECSKPSNLTLTAAEQKHYHQINGLLPHEEKLVGKIIGLLSMQPKNLDPKLLKEHKQLLSFNECERRNIDISSYDFKNIKFKNHYGLADDISFAIGIGDCNKCSDNFDINLIKMKRMNPEAFARLWVGNQLFEYMLKPRKQIFSLGGTSFQIQQDFDTKNRKYIFRRPNGQRFVITNKFSDECFTSEHLLHAIAYKFILFLRVLGFDNPLVEKIYSSEGEKQTKLLGLVMATLMPGDSSLEAKSIASFDMNQLYVTKIAKTSQQDKHEKALLNLDFHDELWSCPQVNVDLLKFLLDNGLDVNAAINKYEDDFALKRVVNRNQNTDAIKLLLSYGANPSLRKFELGHHYNSAVSIAVKEASTELVKLLLDAKVEHPEEKLIQYLVDPAAAYDDADDLLFFLANTYKNGYFDSDSGNIRQKALLLFEHILNTDKEYAIAHFDSYMAAAISKKRFGMAESLMNLAIEYNLHKKLKHRDWGKSTLMEMACVTEPACLLLMEKYLKCFSVDLERRYKANMYSRLTGNMYYNNDNNGNTALHFAAKHNNIMAVKLLLAYSAKASARNHQYCKPIDLTNNEDIIKLLSDFGPKTSNLDRTKHRYSKQEIFAGELGEPVRMYKDENNINVTCVIKANNQDNIPFIFVGQERNEITQKPQGKFKFPCGRLEYSDKSILHCARRIIKQQTGLEVEPQGVKLFQHSFVAQGTKRGFGYESDNVFVYFDLGKQLSNRDYFQAGGDFANLKPLTAQDLENDNQFSPIQKIGATEKLIARHILTGNSIQLSPAQEKTLSQVFNFEKYGYNMLFDAAEKNETKNIQNLVAQGVKYEDHNYTVGTKSPMLELIKQDNLEAVKILLENNYPIEQVEFVDEDGNWHTPLTYASCLGRLRIVKYLLQQGANANPNHIARIPIAAALKAPANRWEIIGELHKHKSDVNYCNERYGSRLRAGHTVRRSPLIQAIKAGDLPAVKELFEKYHSNLNRQRTPFNEYTPLMTALRYNHPNIAMYLLSTNFNNLKFKSGKKSGQKTTLEIAIEKNMPAACTQVINELMTNEIFTFAGLLRDKFGLEVYDVQMITGMDDNIPNTYRLSFSSLISVEQLAQLTNNKPIINGDTYFVDIDQQSLVEILNSKKLAELFGENPKSLFWMCLPARLDTQLHNIYQNRVDQFSYEAIEAKYFTKNLFQIKHILAQNTSLQHLKYSETKQVDNNQAFDQFLNIASYCTNLCSIDFVMSKPLTLTQFQSIVTFLQSRPCIKTIKLTGLDSISPQQFIRTLSKLKNISHNISKPREIIISDPSYTKKSSASNLAQLIHQHNCQINLSTPYAPILYQNTICRAIFKNRQNIFSNQNKPSKHKNQVSNIRNNQSKSIILACNEEHTRRDNYVVNDMSLLELYARLMQKNTSVNTICIDSPSNQAMPYLLSMLANHGNYRHLKIGLSANASKQLSAICDVVLERKMPIDSLRLSVKKSLNDIAVEKLCKLIEAGNIQIKSLNLSDCALSGTQLRMLANSLSKSTSIGSLKLRQKGQTEQDVFYLISQLDHNQSLYMLQYTSPWYEDKRFTISNSQKSAIEQILQRNRRRILATKRQRNRKRILATKRRAGGNPPIVSGV